MPPALGAQSLNYWTTREVPFKNEIYFILLNLFKSFIYLFLATLHGMWDLSSQTRDWTCLEAQSLNHWAAREVPWGSTLSRGACN